ncbi:PaaI family thioesterase [Halocella sp. SP3-1]|uniref:PaaI family thioesterase n=1 Tax=Halocella sp. SP3-1 TaxID=2382161 RepID=UPI000F7612C7|nr:PaaI family thioesterase [Halocella sp. SP3-1]AZO94158.1 PaaI family thioesterase [Halocella sp. SP3-1]
MYNMCFACGKENPISLGLEFSKTDQNKVEADFIPLPEHQGYEGIIHGGIVSTLLDEAMVTAVNSLGVEAVTGELRVRFRQAMKVGKEVHITGAVKKRRAKLVLTEGEIKDKSGQMVALAEAKFMLVE